MRQANVKRIILIHLYFGNVIPSSNLELYCEYLHDIFGVSIGEQYFYRVLRELITEGLVERIKVGVQRKGIKRISYENIYGNKIKNIYRITSLGRKYAKQEYFIPDELDTCEAEISNDAFSQSSVRSVDKKRGTTEYIREERSLRKYKTDVFGQVCLGNKDGNPVLEYVTSEATKDEIISKTVKGSRISGIFKISSYDIAKQKNVIKPLPIICVGGCLLAQNETRETRTLDEIKNLYGESFNEEIILGENYEVLKQYILAASYSKLNNVMKFVTDSVCELDKYKCFHTLDMTGVRQMKNFDVPKDIRLKHQISELRKKGVSKEYLSDEGIRAAESTKVFASVTDDAIVYIGYELEVRSLVVLYNLIFELDDTDGYKNKQLIIICQEGQSKFYKELFQDKKNEAALKDIQIITTEEFI